MPELYRTRAYEPGVEQKFRLDGEYTRFEINNRGPYELLVKFNHDETNWSNPDTMVKPWATQNLSSDYPTSRIMVMGDPEQGSAPAPEDTVPKFSLLASDTGIATTPAYTSVGLLEALRTEIEQVSPTLINNEEPENHVVIALAVSGDAYNRVVLRNTGELRVGDGTAAPQSVGRVAGLDDLADYLPLSGGRMTGDIHLQGNNIFSLPEPAVDGSPATKRYADQQDADHSASDRSYTDQQDADHSASDRSYTDQQVATRLPLSGGRMTGDIHLQGNNIFSLPEPAVDGSPATKRYVDILVPTTRSVPLAVQAGFIKVGNTNLLTYGDVAEIAGQVYANGFQGAGTVIANVGAGNAPRSIDRTIACSVLDSNRAWTNVVNPVRIDTAGNISIRHALGDLNTIDLSGLHWVRR